MGGSGQEKLARLDKAGLAALQDFAQVDVRTGLSPEELRVVIPAYDALVVRSRTEVDEFLRRVAAAPVTPGAGGRGRLIFALDATASREPTWDRAARIQASMLLSIQANGISTPTAMTVPG